jgi:hypothetical protein
MPGPAIVTVRKTPGKLAVKSEHDSFSFAKIKVNKLD